MPAVLVGFALGVWWLQQQAELPAYPGWGLVAAVTAGLGGRLCWTRLQGQFQAGWLPRAGLLLAALVAAAAGFHYAALRAEQRVGAVLAAGDEGRDFDVVGIIRGLPQPVEHGVRFVFDVERVLTADARLPPRLSLGWYTPWRDSAQWPPDLAAGERWQLRVRLRRPHGSANPHGFDVEAWWLENGIGALGTVRPDKGAADARMALRNRRLDAFAGRPIDYVEQARARLRARIQSALAERPYAGVIVALAIGEQRAIPAAQWQVFQRTGVSHLISISGLHITIFATLVGGLAFLGWRRSQRLTQRWPARKAAAVAGLLATGIYVLLAGAGVPAQRTFYMLAVGAAGLWLARPGTALMVLLWSLAAVLLIDPWAVLSAGFWLSFGAVALILWVNVGRLSAGPWWRAALRTQGAVTVGQIPAVLALFQQVSLISPVANAVAIPLVSWVIVPLVLLGALLPFDAPLLIAHQLFAWLAGGLGWLAALPSVVWTQHAPPAWAVLVGGLAMFWLLAPRGTPLRALAPMGLLPMLLVAPAPPLAGSARLTVLDVGQGLAVVVETATHRLLYDTGPRYSDASDAGSRIIVPFLRGAGFARLDRVVVSHQDADHSGGLGSVLAAVPVQAASLSYVTDPPLPAGTTVETCQAGQYWNWDGVHFEFLFPDASALNDRERKPNDRSCVLSIRAGRQRALLTGDIETKAERELLARDPAKLAAEVLVVPHHGSRTSSTPGFLAAVAPRLAVFTPGYRNRFGHPHPAVWQRYLDRRTTALRTDWDGAIRVELGGSAGLHYQGWRATHRRYWHDHPRPEVELPPLDDELAD